MAEWKRKSCISWHVGQNYRQGRGCVNQTFPLRPLSEEACVNGKQLYISFVDLEKACGRVDKKGVREVMKLYGVGGLTSEALKSLCEGNKTCVTIGSKENRMFRVYFDLSQGCVITVAFNLHVDGVMSRSECRGHR